MWRSGSVVWGVVALRFVCDSGGGSFVGGGEDYADGGVGEVLGDSE